MKGSVILGLKSNKRVHYNGYTSFRKDGYQ